MNLEEYGYEKSLSEVLEELSLSLHLLIGKPCNIKLLLPDEAINQFYAQFKPIEKISLENSQSTKHSVSKMYCTSGIVELLKYSEFDLVKKEDEK